MIRDLKQLQGRWSIVSLEVDGASVSSSEAAQIAIDGDSFTTSGMGDDYSGKVTIDARAKTIDLTFETGPEKGNRNLGIYKLDGDRWTMCLATRGDVRPSEFATRPGTGFALETLRRGVSDAGPKVSLGDIVAAPELEGEWQMLGCAIDGKPLPAEYVKQGKRVAKANDMIVTVSGQTMLRARFNVNRSTQPLSIDYLTSQGKLQHGIYRIEKEVLETIFSAPGSARPRDFKPAAGTTWSKWKKA